MNNPDEVQLIQRCRSGDSNAIEMLVERYQWAVFRLALSILEDPAEAEEATQDAFVSALGALDSYKGKAAFKTWLFAITINKCRGRLRQRQSRERLVKIQHLLIRENNPSRGHPEEQAMLNEREHQIRMAVEALDEKRRWPVILRYYHELPIAEIALVLGVSERTVHNRLYSAHMDLFGRLDGLER
jgi:RNA polymerase sigma-70 factor, ECF subfamily